VHSNHVNSSYRGNVLGYCGGEVPLVDPLGLTGGRTTDQIHRAQTEKLPILERYRRIAKDPTELPAWIGIYTNNERLIPRAPVKTPAMAARGTDSNLLALTRRRMIKWLGGASLLLTGTLHTPRAAASAPSNHPSSKASLAMCSVGKPDLFEPVRFESEDSKHVYRRLLA
jgi:hypothetical protein